MSLFKKYLIYLYFLIIHFLINFMLSFFNPRLFQVRPLVRTARTCRFSVNLMGKGCENMKLHIWGFFQKTAYFAV